MMKRWIAAAAALALLLLPAAARADGAALFSIDDKDVFTGMDKAYEDGYTPKISGGIATIVLPLVASGAIAGSELTATPNLGDANSSPFAVANYQKTVTLASNPVGDGSTSVSCYLVRFDLPLKSGRINGSYPVTITINAQTPGGSAVEQSFTSYVTVTDGKNPNAAPKTPKPVSEPKILVSAYRIDPSPAVAGDEFTATVTLQNTSAAQAVQNMTVSITCDSPDFMLENDSSTVFIGKLGKGSSTDVEFKYRTSLETQAQQYNLSLAVEYDNSDAQTLSSTGTVPVLVSQPLRVEMTTPKIADSVNAGDTLPLSFQVMNLGRSKIYNVRCEIAAPGLIPSGDAFIGDMEGGTAQTAEMDVFVGTKDMTKGYTGDDKYGPTQGKVTLVYEDDAGKEYRQDTDISTTINEPVIPDASIAAPQEQPKKASQWWVSVLIGAVVVAGLAVLLVTRGKQRGRRHESA